MRRSIGVLTLAMILHSATASALCTNVAGWSMGSFSLADTSSATRNYETFELGSFEPGETIIVGTTGFLPGSPATGDVFLRLIDNVTQAELARNDDACDGLQSRVVYTIPTGRQQLAVRVGCYAEGACSGTVYLYHRLDSNGRIIGVQNAFAVINPGGAYVLWASYGGGGIIPSGYDEDTFGGGPHFQGVVRLRHRSQNWLAVSGDDFGDIMFMRILPSPGASEGDWVGRWVDNPVQGNPASRAVVNRQYYMGLQA